MAVVSKVTIFHLTLALIGFFIMESSEAYAEECSLAKTNHSCTLTIDRKNPLMPPTIQMYPKQTLTVVVKNPYYFERYFMDFQGGQLALTPDVASSILGSLLTPLQSGVEPKAALAAPSDNCSPAKIGAMPIPPSPHRETSMVIKAASICTPCLIRSSRIQRCSPGR
jgi:hypothetical protein